MPNITFGADVVKALRPLTTAVFDCHLMITPADPFLEAFAKAGADIITVHAEAGRISTVRCRRIRSLGKKAGVAINPATPESAVEYLLDQVDLILVMTVNPGFGGQKYIDATTDKIRRVHKMIGDRPIELEVDGGITAETIGVPSGAGANVFVAGSAIYKGAGLADYRANIEKLRNAAESAR